MIFSAREYAVLKVYKNSAHDNLYKVITKQPQRVVFSLRHTLRDIVAFLLKECCCLHTAVEHVYAAIQWFWENIFSGSFSSRVLCSTDAPWDSFPFGPKSAFNVAFKQFAVSLHGSVQPRTICDHVRHVFIPLDGWQESLSEEKSSKESCSKCFFLSGHWDMKDLRPPPL